MCMGLQQEPCHRLTDNKSTLRILDTIYLHQKSTFQYKNKNMQFSSCMKKHIVFYFAHFLADIFPVWYEYNFVLQIIRYRSYLWNQIYHLVMKLQLFSD